MSSLRRSPIALLVGLAAWALGCNVYEPSLLGGTADGGSEACSSTCGGACVDLVSDPKNCGACGKTCKSTCTASLCDPDVVIDQRNAPHAIAVDATQAFFTEYSAVQITGVDKLTGQNLVVVSGQAVYPEGLVLDPTFVYWTNANDKVGALGRAPKIPGPPPPPLPLAKSLPTPSAIALDGNGNVYFATGPSNKAPNCLATDYASAIVRCPTSGCYVADGCPTSGGPQVVITESAPPSALVISGTTLYFASRSGKTLKSCTLPACSGLSGFPATLSGPTDVAISSDSVYVADADGGNVVRCDRVTRACAPIATKIDQPWRLAIDGNDLFFTSYGKAVKNAAGLWRCKLPDCAGGPTKLAAGTSFYGITVDAQNVYFTAEGSTAGTSLDGKILRLARP